MVGNHVQLSVTPPSHGDVASQRRLDATLGFDDVLRAARPLPSSLSDFPHYVGELIAKLSSVEVELAAAKFAVVPEMMAPKAELLEKERSQVDEDQF
ncbi:hypothetical protein PInf_005304 [Phytophthora infestans]|nr:hypothetical protein PInf_005304 [Phytophthora infestans]